MSIQLLAFDRHLVTETYWMLMWQHTTKKIWVITNTSRMHYWLNGKGLFISAFTGAKTLCPLYLGGQGHLTYFEGLLPDFLMWNPKLKKKFSICQPRWSAICLRLLQTHPEYIGAYFIPRNHNHCWHDAWKMRAEYDGLLQLFYTIT